MIARFIVNKIYLKVSVCIEYFLEQSMGKINLYAWFSNIKVIQV